MTAADLSENAWLLDELAKTKPELAAVCGRARAAEADAVAEVLALLNEGAPPGARPGGFRQAAIVPGGEA